MINSLKLKDFRNFEDREFFFSQNKNFIIGENGKGKTNILEAISLITPNTLNKINFEDLTNKDSDIFYIEGLLDSGDKVSIFYDKKTNKKKYSINNKSTTKTNINKKSIKSVNFSPIIMNMFYMSPSTRRDFLDNILESSFEKYGKYLKEFKNILQNRNKLLKNIKDGKSKKTELEFWDKKFIESCKIIYNFRFGIIDYLKDNIQSSKNYFLGKVNNIKLEYKTKVQKDKVEEYIKSYIEKNLDRDIILGKTAIGPHIDDFEIYADGIVLQNFASRGELKSVVLDLKMLEINFIEKYTKSKPILLIDDLFSELDENHKNMLLEKIANYQTFITGINFQNVKNENVIFLY